MPEQGFPFKETCDLSKPEEFAVWALVALPGQNGAPLIMPVSYLQLVSKRLWECGFRLVEEPVIKYRPPGVGDPHWMTNPGSWVSVDTPDPPVDPASAALARLAPAQKAAILKRLLDEAGGQ